MKYRLRLLLAFFLPFSLDARDDAAVREVADGKRTEARADWWGFDEKDATAALQAAIKSAAKRVIVPMHNKDLPKGTFFSILKQAGIDKGEL